ncbi:hypothetical protein MHAE_16831 [Mycobacterium haemophilum DSM 44634]
MDLSRAGLIVGGRTEEARKKLRYAVVSVVFVPPGQILIQVFGLWFDDYTAASLLSAGIVLVPNFFANKHFVWRVTSRKNVGSQVVVSWVAMMLGVAQATLLTHFVENVMADQTRLVRGPAVFLAQLVGYGIVWVGRFFILDRWLFKLTGATPEPNSLCRHDFSRSAQPQVAPSVPAHDQQGPERCQSATGPTQHRPPHCLHVPAKVRGQPADQIEFACTGYAVMPAAGDLVDPKAQQMRFRREL